MKPSLAASNIAAQYRFHLTLRGALVLRLLYLTLYYSSWLLLRWGDRHTRALRLLKVIGLSDLLVLVRMPDGLRLQMDLYTAYDALYPIYEGKIYEPRPEFEPQPGNIVLDVGAQQGIFACRAALKVGRLGRVIAFEPHPGNYKILLGNASRNDLRNILAVDSAVSDRIGKADLHLHAQSTNYSLSRETGAGTVQVRLTKLDQVLGELDLPRVNLIKMDIEGAAIEALGGAKKLLERFKPKIVMEFESEAERTILPDKLRELGYEVETTPGYLYAR